MERDGTRQRSAPGEPLTLDLVDDHEANCDPSTLSALLYGSANETILLNEHSVWSKQWQPRVNENALGTYHDIWDKLVAGNLSDAITILIPVRIFNIHAMFILGHLARLFIVRFRR